MSLVNLDYKLFNSENIGKTENYEVYCKDLSNKPEEEIIGILSVNFETKCFSYKPSSFLIQTFCPPELFVEYEGDYSEVEDRLEEKGFNCAFWSYSIYKEANKILNGTSIFGGLFDEMP